jgi:hypothetical protein
VPALLLDALFAGNLRVIFNFGGGIAGALDTGAGSSSSTCKGLDIPNMIPESFDSPSALRPFPLRRPRRHYPQFPGLLPQHLPPFAILHQSPFAYLQTVQQQQQPQTVECVEALSDKKLFNYFDASRINVNITMQVPMCYEIYASGRLLTIIRLIPSTFIALCHRE